MDTRPDLTALEAALGHRFQRRELLELALTHSSFAHEAEQKNGPAASARDNEQLEFLGDAVLGFVTSDTLTQRFPEFREGQLSKLRAHLVSERNLVRAAQAAGIGEALLLGRGEERSGGRAKSTLLADALEAVLAAVYLDAGLEAARALILAHLIEPELALLNTMDSVQSVTDFKSALQEELQAAGHAQPSYVVTDEDGPDHRKRFTVEVRIQGAAAGFATTATGLTKKQAEQAAAEKALEHIRARSASNL